MNFLGVVNWLLQKDPRQLAAEDNLGFLPLHVAVAATVRLPALRLVLESWEGAVLACTGDGDSLMHVACKAGAPAVLQYLLHIGISTTLRNHKG